MKSVIEGKLEGLSVEHAPNTLCIRTEEGKQLVFMNLVESIIWDENPSSYISDFVGRKIKITVELEE